METDNNHNSLRRIRFAIFTFYFCQGLVFSTWASRIPDIKMTLGLGDAAWGTILLMIPIGQACGMTISGLLVSRIGSRRIMPVALIGYVFSLLLVGFSKSEYALIMSLIVLGFCGNFCNIAVNTQAVALESMYKKPIMASFHGGWSLAGLTGASIGLLMAAIHFDPLVHFSIVGVAIIISLVTNKRYLLPDIKKNVEKSDKEKKKNKPESFLFWLGIIAFCGMAAEGAMADWSGLYLIDVVGISKNYAPLGLTAYMITMALGRFLIDSATQRWGRKRIIQVGGTLITIGLFAAVAFPHFLTTLFAFMIIGFGTAGIVPSIYSIAGQRTKISTSIALTIVSSVSFLGFLMGPPLIGYIASVTNLRYSYAMIGLFGICIVILASKIKVLKLEK